MANYPACTHENLLKATLAAACNGDGSQRIRRRKPEPLRYWDNHAGYGYAGPQDVALLDHWRSAGMNYLSINVGYDPVPWSTAVRAIADYTKGIESRRDIILCPTFADVQHAWRNGEMAVTYDLEGMGALNGDLSMSSCTTAWALDRC